MKKKRIMMIMSAVYTTASVVVAVIEFIRFVRGV